MLNIHNLKKKFGNLKAVDGISFDLNKGQVLGFLGANGAGKTTTMRMISGYLKPDDGDITICGINAIKNTTETQSKIGYLPEGAPLYGDMTPLEYLTFIGEVRLLNKKELKIAIERLINDTIISDILNRPIDRLSKGYKRRVGLASALLIDPPILILDEPTDGLDPNQKHHVRELIRKLSKDKAIIISTHILEEVDAICTDTVIIDQGKIISYATPKELISRSELYNAVSIIIESEAAHKAVDIFEKQDFIEQVSLTGIYPKWTKMFLFPKNKEYILGEVSSMLHKEKWQIAGVHSEKGSLDEVFRSLTA